MKYDEKYIVEEYLKGRTQKDIAVELGTFNTSIRRILLRNGIKPRNSREAQKRFVNHNFLKDSHYWLGLLASDGCITGHSIVLQLQERDKYILELFAKAGGKLLKVNSYHNFKYNLTEYYVKFKNLEIEEYLISLGITPRKSDTLDYKGEINWEFFRGYFDGDGSVFKETRSNRLRVTVVCKSEKMVNLLSNFLKEEGIHHTITYYKAKDLYCINICKQSEIFKMYNRLYDGKDLIYFTRKKEKFGPLVEKFTKKTPLIRGNLNFQGNPELGTNLEL